MTDKLTIRKFQKEDIEALLSLYEDLGYPTTASSLTERLDMIFSQPHYGCLLAEKNGEIVGFLGYAKLFFFEADGSYYRILALSVAKEARRQGVASKLVDELKNQAKREKVTALALNSGLSADRSVAHQFYQALGFKKVTAGFALYLESE